MAEISSQQGHPRGLYLLFFTEMWERFSYYGMRAIFILFMTKALFMEKAFASNIYGSFTGLVYLTPLLGGYVSDRFWGNRRSILVGGLLMAIGQFVMFLSANAITEASQSTTAVSLMWIGLTILIIGNGFFKPNISTMVGQLYPKGDHRTDGAFTIFYMGINLGAFFSPLVCGTLGDTGSIYDFRWGFLAACIGMLVSMFAFVLLKNKHLKTPDGKPVGMPKTKMDMKMFAGLIGICGLIFFLLTFKSLFKINLDITGYLIYTAILIMPIIIFSDKSLIRDEKERIGVIFILAFFVIFFWACFEQAGASLTLFADSQVRRDVNIHISSLVILITGLVLGFLIVKSLAWFFEWKKGVSNGVQVVIIVAQILLYAMGYMQDFVKTEFPASWFQSINPLGIFLLAPLYTLFWNFLNRHKLEPSSPMKMAYGLLLLALGYAVIAYGVHGVDARTKISMWWLIALYILHTMGELSLSPIGLSMVSKLSPARFGSLLMGTWFLSNAVANKFAGTLSALIPPGAGEAPAEIGAQFPVFLGIEISNLFTFFCLFIVLSGTASVALFAMYRWLEKRMHGVK
jgi:POT family proton-dependent oligopeptide transporter